MTGIQSPVPEPAAGAQAPGVSRAIYGMPMFATLLARDVGATVSWYTGGLGFISLFSIPGPGAARYWSTCADGSSRTCLSGRLPAWSRRATGAR